MNQRTPVPVRSCEQDRCVGTLVCAFADDPIARWVFQEPSRYLDHFPRVVSACATVALQGGTAWEVDDDSGTALWLAPGQEPDEAALAAAVGEGVPADRQPGVFEFLERMAEAHPEGPHWYLPLIGVSPRHPPLWSAWRDRRA